MPETAREPANRIAGRPRPAAGTGRFDVAAAEPQGGPLGRWPRSGAGDVAFALSAAGEGGPAWAARTPEERASILSRAAAALREDPDHGGDLGSRLGAKRREVLELAGRLEPRVASRATAPGPGPVLVRRHWSELYRGLFESLALELAAGRTAVVVSDPSLPMLADRVADALGAAGVDDGVIAVLHDDGETALRAALATGSFARLVASGHSRERHQLARLCAAEGARLRAVPFGAGVVDDDCAGLEFEPLESGVLEVGRDDDPEHRAREAAAGAFGRVDALSGQAPDQIGLVVIDPIRLASFTSALLAEIEGSADYARPLAFLDEGLEADLMRARTLGLDEGATLIHEGHALDSRRAGADGTLVRLVFTNVETGMRLAAPPRPGPLLRLVRSETTRVDGTAPSAE